MRYVGNLTERIFISETICCSYRVKPRNAVEFNLTILSGHVIKTSACVRNREYRLCVHLFIHLNYSASSVAAVTKLKSTVRHVSCSLIDPGMWRVIDQLDDLATAAVSASHSCTVFSNENSLRLLVGRSVGRSVCDAGRRGVALMRSITARRQQQQQVGGAD